MNQNKTTLVLGDDIGGIAAATRLRRQLPAIHHVILIEGGGGRGREDLVRRMRLYSPASPLGS